MKKIEEFYSKSIKFNKPSGLLKGFYNNELDKKLPGKVAIDLGAGVGNDVAFLIKKGFKVTCVDKEKSSKEIITNRIVDKKNLSFIISDFENVKLHKADLIYSCFSLQFCNPEKIDNIMNEINTNIVKDGFFVR